MVTDASLRDLLRTGHETTDADFVAHFQEHTSRTAYFMAQFLAERQNEQSGSAELQNRIKDQLRTSCVVPKAKFNPVDWFSEQWTQFKRGRPTTKYFKEEYVDLFDRSHTQPWSYRIKPALYEDVVRILGQLRSFMPSRPTVASNGRDSKMSSASRATTGDRFPSIQMPSETPFVLSRMAEQLDNEGMFDPTSFEDARTRALRAVVVREGQPQFRAALLAAYGGRCAITECDAAPALEAAHVKPYEGFMTNVVSNGILLRADVHTLFDLDLIGIDPGERLIHVSKQLGSTAYRKLDGTPLREPNDPSASPNRAALEWRWQRFLGQK
jgi:hypothetical protein